MRTRPEPRTPAIFAVGAVMWALLCAGCTQHTTSPTLGATAGVDLNERPASLKSILFQGISLPFADQGPHGQSGPVVSGFDRSPIGAALAAIQATVRISVATDSQWADIGQQMLAPGLGRDAWAVARAQLSITAPITGTAPLIAGYRIVHYSSTDAAVDIYTTQSDRSITCNAAQVIWQGNDWKLLLPNQPHSAPVTAVPALPADAIALPLH